jgi:hypothetical protein
MSNGHPRAAGTEPKGKADAGTASVTLPTDSPFFRDETGVEAGKRLRALFKRDDREYNESLLLVRNRKPKIRADLCAGAALLAPGKPPTLGGWNLERVVPCDSLPKLYVMYAFYQLHADVAFLGATIDVSAAPNAAAKVDAFRSAVAAAFVRAKDPALQQIGKTPSIMPRLTHLFILTGFVDQPPSKRSQDTLAFDTLPGSGQANAAEDNWTAHDRLQDMIHISNNAASTSLIADIGLPYITAWLQRSGLAYLAEKENGLWLAAPYGKWPNRKSPDPPPVSTLPAKTRATGGVNKGENIVQAGSVLGHATALLLLQREQLVNRWASAKMVETMPRGAMLADRINKEGQSVSEGNKVGIDTRYARYSEAVLLTTQPKSLRPDAGTPGELTWCTVVLDFNTPLIGNDNTRHNVAISEFADLGFEFEVEVAKLAARPAKK